VSRVAAVAVAVAAVALVIAIIAVAVPGLLATNEAGITPQQISVERVVLEPESIELTVRNGGLAPVEIAQISVNDAYWIFHIDRAEIPRLQTARIHIVYPWQRGEPLQLKLVASDGQTAIHSIDFPVETPRPGMGLLGRYVPLGLFMGLVPVGAGMLARPFLRRSKKKVWEFFLAFTVGVLLAIGISSALEAFELSAELVTPLSGRLLVVTSAALSFAVIYEGARWIGSHKTIESSVVAAWALAVAIGLHNLGEGLAVAGSEAAGAVAVGALLALGFAVHNISEGVAIASVMGRQTHPFALYLGTVGVAGAPALAGLMLGSLAPSKLVSVILLGVGLGAIVEVIVEVWDLVFAGSGSRPPSYVVSGIVSGLGFMYLTSLLLS
jgi:ZIP family zinc transporter